jgi:hypothetical protein
VLIEHHPDHLTKGPILPFHNTVLSGNIWCRKLMLRTKIATKGLKTRVLGFRAIVIAYCSNSIAMYLILLPQDQVSNKTKGLILISQGKYPCIERLKTSTLSLNALFRCTEVAKHPFCSIGTKMMFQSVTEQFAHLLHVKRCKTCVSGLNALFRGTKVAKHAFYSIETKMLFRSVSKHFTERCNKCVAGLNALSQGIKVVKHPFYSIGPKTIFGSVWKHFANLQHVKRGKICVSGLNALFWATKVVKHPFYSIGTKMMFGSV